MIRKVKATKIIEIPQKIEYEVFQTSDGRQFNDEESAIEHEKVGDIKQQKIRSKIINNEYLSQYIGNFKFVKFENEKQVEAYEQKECGNKDNNTWDCWESCKEKFKFPCWVMCYYVPHNLCEEYPEDDYTAIYMTLDEVKTDLEGVFKQIDNLH